MDQRLQGIAKRYYDEKSDKNFKAYYDAYKPVVYAVAIKILKDYDDANECVSWVFLKLHKNSLKEIDPFVFDNTKSHLSYVYTMATHAAINGVQKIKKKKEQPISHIAANSKTDISNMDLMNRMKNSVSEEDVLSGYEDFLDEKFAHNDSIKQAAEAVDIIKNLQDGHSEMLYDALVLNKSYKVIAKEYGLQTEGAVKTRVFRSKKRIRSELSRRVNLSMLEDGYHVSDFLPMEQADYADEVDESLKAKEAFHKKISKIVVDDYLSGEAEYVDLEDVKRATIGNAGSQRSQIHFEDFYSILRLVQQQNIPIDAFDAARLRADVACNR